MSHSTEIAPRSLRSQHVIIPKSQMDAAVRLMRLEVCKMLRCIIVCCCAVQCAAVHCSVLLCVAVCCCALQCAAVRCSVLLCVAVSCSPSRMHLEVFLPSVFHHDIFNQAPLVRKIWRSWDQTAALFI